MANEKKFYNKEVLIFKETTEGVTPPIIAKAFRFGVMTLDFDRNQRTEENPELGNGGEASRTDTGGDDPSGTLDVKYKADLFPILTHAILGEADTKTTHSTAHATTTAYAVDDVVILTSKVLICTTAGTSGATAPDLTGATDKDSITDDTVVWLYRDKTAVYDYDGVNKLDLPSMGMMIKDRTEQGAGVDFERIGRGVYLQGISLGKEGGNIIYKNSISTLMHGIIPSTETGYTSPTITDTVDIEDNPYKRDDLCVTIGGVAPSQAPSFMLNIERNITIDDGVACIEVAGVKTSEKITSVGIPKVSGNLVVRMSKEEYKEAYENTEKAIVIEYRRPSGEFAKFTLPLVQLLDPKTNYTTDKPIELDIPLNAYGNSSTSTVTYNVRSFLNF